MKEQFIPTRSVRQAYEEIEVDRWKCTMENRDLNDLSIEYSYKGYTWIVLLQFNTVAPHGSVSILCF